MDIAGHNLASGQPQEGLAGCHQAGSPGEDPPGLGAGGSGREYQAAARSI